jgi:hypothetical protein
MLQIVLFLGFFVAATIGIFHATESAFAQTTHLQAIAWSKMSPEQQKVLAPFKEQWSTMSAKEQQEWNFLSAHYQHLNADDKTKLDIRIRDWAALPVSEREAVKRNYEQASKQAPVAERAKIWEMYQTLQPVHKKSLLPQQ